MSRVLVIGCGGVANVAIRKCCQADDVFTELCIASRTKSKCDALAEALKGKTKTVVTTAQVDADKVDELVAAIPAMSTTATTGLLVISLTSSSTISFFHAATCAIFEPPSDQPL